MTQAEDQLERRAGAGHPGGPALAHWLAVLRVMVSSAAVLVLEILAGRLLAPYIGVSLETYTGIIGTVLAGIALGAGLGGRMADRRDPRALLPVLFVAGGAAAMLAIPTIRIVGGWAGPDITGRTVLLSGLGFLPSAMVLSAVAPAVVKLQLRDLGATGSIVGRLSAFGTAGAIVGTFMTGFVLVRWAAVTTLIIAVGLVLIALGVTLWLVSGRQAVRAMAWAGTAAAVGLTGVITVEGPCDRHTSYYCLSVRVDPAQPSGRTLVLDDLSHSYIDLADPTHLEFWYIRSIVDSIEALAPAGPLDVVYLGGGALSIPRYLRATRAGSDQTVLEIDADLAELVEQDLGFKQGPDVEIVIGDGRLSMAALATDSADVVVGDAFGSRAVPWHLATEEFLGEVQRVLRPGGIYSANIIDNPGGQFLRAEAATIRRVLPHLQVIRGPLTVAGRAGNSIIVASDRPIAAAALEARRVGRGELGETVADLDVFLADAQILTDEFAPVDQLIAAGG